MDIKQVSAVEGAFEASAATRKTAAQASATEAAPTPDQVKEAVNAIQRHIGKSSTNVTFALDESSGRTIVSVVDTETREVIRQMPTEEVLQIARALGRLQGMLFNGQA